MLSGLDYLNSTRKDFSLASLNDAHRAVRYGFGMAKPAHDWYAPEWMRYYGKAQADLEKDLDWNKSKASLMMRRKQRYHRDDVNELADYLNLRPFELLMPPEEAMAFRAFRASAGTIAAVETPEEPASLNARLIEREQRRGGDSKRKSA